MSTPTNAELSIITEREENRRAIDSINMQVRTKPLTIAETILYQLGGNRFTAMTGAKNFVDHGNGLSCRIGRNCKGVNYVEITLNNDTYQVEFLQICRQGTVKIIADVDNIQAEDLQRVFTMHTGMDTHL